MQADATALTGAGNNLGVSTNYFSFANTEAEAVTGQSNSNAASGQGNDTGVTTGTTISSGDVTYSLANRYQLGASDVINYSCGCGYATASETISATVL